MFPRVFDGICILMVSEGKRWSVKAAARGSNDDSKNLQRNRKTKKLATSKLSTTKQPLDALADLLLTPFPPELRGKIRRSVADTAKAFDDLLIRLGGGGQKALK